MNLLPAGALTALITPFTSKGLVDLHWVANLVRRQCAAGTSALVACGSTGEAMALTLGEYEAVIGTTIAASTVPVIAGCGASATAQACEAAAIAAGLGANAILCAPPPYLRPTQEGIYRHVNEVSAAAMRPVMLYDVPSRTAVAIADDTIRRLHAAGAISAFKDATADLARPARLAALCGDSLLQMSGDDATAAAYLAAGGHGCVSVTGNVAPRAVRDLQDAWRLRDLPVFASSRQKLAPLNAALFVETNPIPVKAAMSLVTGCPPGLRLPLLAASSTTLAALRGVLAEWTTDELQGADLVHAPT